MKDNGTLKMVAIGLGVVAAALLILLIVRGHKASEQIAQDQTDIASFSNQLAQATGELDQNKQVVTNLEADLNARKADILTLSNSLVTANASLTEAQDSLKTSQDEIAKRDATIAKLEAHNSELEKQANELNDTVTTLNARIQDVSQKLASSEGDKAALSAELKRLLREKADLERKFNDIAALRAQIKKIKTDLNVARRLDRASEGLPASSEPKGAQKQMGFSTQPRLRHYDLNVEVNSDGSVKVIPPINKDEKK